MSQLKEEQLANCIEYSTLSKFLKVVKSVQEFVSAGVLRQTDGNCSVFDIQGDGPWPTDSIVIYFESNPSKIKYILSCDTYHGSGGHFKKL